MSLEIDIITDLAGLMIIGSVVTITFYKLKQLIVAGYPILDITT